MPEEHAKYPRDKQNPPAVPGERPADQPPPQTRVPDERPNPDDMTTDERMRDDPKRSDLMTPVKEPDKPGRTWQ